MKEDGPFVRGEVDVEGSCRQREQNMLEYLSSF